MTLQIHIYQLSTQTHLEHFSAASPGIGDNDEDAEDADVQAASVAELPSAALEGVWTNLIFESGIKERLLNVRYLLSTLYAIRIDA